MANRPFEASHSRGTVRPMLERMGLTLTEKKKTKTTTKTKSSYRWITPSEISIILQMI